MMKSLSLSIGSALARFLPPSGSSTSMAESDMVVKMLPGRSGVPGAMMVDDW